MILTPFRIVIAAVLSVAFVAPCLAQGSASGAIGKQCSKDIGKFCTGMRQAEARSCLESKRSQLSAACQRALNTPAASGGGSPDMSSKPY